MFVHKVLHCSGQGFGERFPADRRVALLRRDLDLDSVHDSAVTRSVCLQVVSASIVSVRARAWEFRGRHDAVTFSAKVMTEAVGTRAADQVIEAGVCENTAQDDDDDELRPDISRILIYNYCF